MGDCAYPSSGVVTFRCRTQQPLRLARGVSSGETGILLMIPAEPCASGESTWRCRAREPLPLSVVSALTAATAAVTPTTAAASAIFLLFLPCAALLRWWLLPGSAGPQSACRSRCRSRAALLPHHYCSHETRRWWCRRHCSCPRRPAACARLTSRGQSRTERHRRHRQRGRCGSRRRRQRHKRR